jgi:hypothetical protein
MNHPSKAGRILKIMEGDCESVIDATLGREPLWMVPARVDDALLGDALERIRAGRRPQLSP